MEGIVFSEHIALISFIVVLLPLSSFIFAFFLNKKLAGNIALFNISVSFFLSLFLASKIWNKVPVHYQVDWFLVGDTQFQAGVLLNNLSLLMISLVSGIALLVHIYSRSYMANDPKINKYWAYLGLFCFSMLSLSIVDNLLLIYIFWEFVGFSSYLLIGFWYTKQAAAQASKKAFIINRIGDLGLLMGIMIIYSQFNTLDISKLFSENALFNISFIKDGFWIFESQQMPAMWLTITGLGFFIGAMAKSAQFPLHTWLPDAMEGPTSVSSLIHAATMVAAGVFLIARVYPVFDPIVLNIMVIIGTFTAFMAATIALTQNDIKRILAYSTISQLGFMVMAMGIGAYSESIFHLTSHAFFKCLLFLAAGSVIHQLHHYRDKLGLSFDHQNIESMGGLRKSMPITFITMCIASASLIGLPLTSGYLSKDAIVISAFNWAEGQNMFFQLIPYLMIITSWLTAFYICRLLFKVFFKKSTLLSDSQILNIKDPAKNMSTVLIVLAIFCFFFIFSFNPLSIEDSWILHIYAFNNIQSNHLFHWLIPFALTTGTLFLIILTYSLYVKQSNFTGFKKSILFTFSKHEWYFNDLYNYIFVSKVEKFSFLIYWFDRNIIDFIVLKSASMVRFSSIISHAVDKHLVDGFVNGLAGLSKAIGRQLQKLQGGKLQQYLLTMLMLLLLFLFIIYFYKLT